MPNKSFVNASEYRKLSRELDDAVGNLTPDSDAKQIDDAFKAYANYFELTDRIFPLLLRVGDPLTLPRAPSALYLLPPLKDADDARFLIAQFPRTPGREPEIGIFTWTPAKEDGHDDRITPFGLDIGDTRGIYPLDVEECDLSTRPRRITPLALSTQMVAVQLQFDNGTLTLSVGANSGTVAPIWVPTPSQSASFQVERRSGGEMPPALSIQRVKRGEEWCDDLLHTPNDEWIVLTETNTGFPLSLGRINGADGLPESDDLFLGANNGQVLRLTVKNDSAEGRKHGEIRRSPVLGGLIEDILVVPKQDEEFTPQVLAPCYDGRIYLLEPGDDGIPEVRFWQAAERLHIRRIMAADKDQILAVDQYHRVWPLRLNDAYTHQRRRNRATEMITGYLPDGWRSYKNWKEPLEKARRHALIIAWFHAIQGEESRDSLSTTLIDLIATIKGDMERDPDKRQAAAEAYYALLKPLWRVWTNIRSHFKPKAIPESRFPEAISVIQRLLELPRQAPDWLWFKLFREWDLYRFWAEAHGMLELEAFKRGHETIAKQVFEQRRAMGLRSHQLRPLTAYASYRLPAQARHIRALHSRGAGGQLRFVCTSYSQGLYAFELDPSGGNHPKGDPPTLRQLARLSNDNDPLPPWRGQVRSLVTLPPTEGRKEDYLVIGTQRGECRLLKLGPSSFHIADERDIPLDCATARAVRHQPHHHTLLEGVLLAGQSPGGNDAIHWLPIKRQGRFGSHRVLFTGKHSGRLRMLVSHQDERELRLWAIDAERGQLLYWPNLKQVLSHNGELSEPQIWWRASGGLYALSVQGEGADAQVICAGHDGVAMAFVALGEHAGRMAWSTGCGTAIRRLRVIGDNQPIIALAGDSEHILCFDKLGRPTGMLEGVGPVSALADLGEGKEQILLIGAKSGRLLAMTPQPLGKPIRTDHCSLNYSEHPVRAMRPDNVSFKDILIHLSASEPLIFQEGLKQLWNWLDRVSPPSPSDIRRAELTIRLRHMSDCRPDWLTHRSALSLLRPRSLNDGNDDWPDTCEPVLDEWLDAHWEALNKRYDSDARCPIIDAALTLKERRAIAGSDSARRWVTRQSDTLWSEEASTFGLNPKHALNRLRLMRETQAMRIWRETAQPLRGRPQRHPTIEWVNRLSLLWLEESGEGKWDPRIRWLAERGIPGTQDGPKLDQWALLLRDPSDAEAPHAVGLEILHTPCFEGWTKPDQLRGLFGKPSAPSSPLEAGSREGAADHWSFWIDQLHQALSRVKEMRESRPHRAWQEEEALERLIDQTGPVADKLLDAPHGLALAGYYWRARRDEWLKAINSRINELHDLELEPSLDHYLDCETHYHWEDAKRVQVRLDLSFRGTRGLQIERALDPNGRAVDSSIPMLIPADLDRHDYEFTIEATAHDRLECEIGLKCRDFRGIRFLYPVRLKDKRGVEGFRGEQEWGRQARRLLGLLEREHHFNWLRGPNWPFDEHERLLNLVRERYPSAIERIHMAEELDQVDQESAIFVPDLPLIGAATSPSKEGPRTSRALDTLVTLLTWKNYGRTNRWALAVWLWCRSSEPTLQRDQRIAAALGEWLPSLEETETLIERLLGHDRAWETLGDRLRPLSDNKLIDWVRGQAPVGGATLGDLGAEIWRKLTGGDLDTTTLKGWLGEDGGGIDAMESYLRHAGALTTPPGNSDRPEEEWIRIATPLFDALFPGIPIGAIQGIPYVNHPLTILHQEYDRCMVAPPGLPLPTASDCELSGVWLFPGRQSARVMPGLVLKLDEDAILPLFTLGRESDGMAARLRLSAIAGRQHPVHPEILFQAAFGLDDDRIVTAFHGRRHELNLLKQALKQRGGGSALVVGGRRAGKSTLLKRLRHDLRHRKEHRHWVEISGLAIPVGPDDDREKPFLRWFLGQIRDGLDKRESRVRYQWPDVGNWRQKEEAINTVTHRLAQLAEQGKRAILLLDETAGLLQRDIASTYSVGNLLRQWRQQGLVTVIATAYPLGTDEMPSLSDHRHLTQGNNPWYNLFGTAVFRLKPWSPGETWRFFEPRLAGFGLSLAPGLPPRVLELCRGVPWVAQTLGESVSRFAQGHDRALITLGDWSEVASDVRVQIRRLLADQVRSLAEELDREASVNPERTPNQSLQHGRLWSALAQEARRFSNQGASPESNRWPPATRLSLDRFAEALKPIARTRQATILNALCDVEILAPAQSGESDSYEFWCDLMPIIFE